MWLVTQSTGIDVAVHDIRRDRFGIGSGERLPRSWRLAAVARGATRCVRVASASLLDELMARQASNLGHAMLMHGHFGVATGAREAIDRSSVLFEHVALVASQVRLHRDVILVTNRPRRLRFFLRIEMASLATR